jgi:ABC-type transporter Mla subunit MlaD
MLQGINDTLVDRLADNVGRSITRAMTPVAESMDRFIVGATRNQIEGVNQIVSRFLTEMDRSLGNQFTSLAQTMSALEQGQLRAVQATGGNISAAEGIVRSAQSLQEITAHTLDQFDGYMTQINTVRERDEGFEKRASELLEQMRQESKDMASLISGLTDKMQALSTKEEDPADKTLGEIRDLMSTLNENVKTVSKTLSKLSEEA